MRVLLDDTSGAEPCQLPSAGMFLRLALQIGGSPVFFHGFIEFPEGGTLKKDATRGLGKAMM